MPPGNGKVTLLRQDGSRLDATPEQAEKLKLLGYREEAPEELHTAAGASAEEDYYTTTGQQIATAGEGLLRGASVGTSDYLFSDDETGKRAEYNPGIAAATEIGGAIAAEFVPGVNLLAPSALIGRGARAAVAGERLGAKAIRGAIEGGAFGGAMAADHAYISGDPVTSEAVLHGIGWGTLFGGGLAGAGAALGARGAKNLAAGAVQEAEAGALAGAAGRAEGAEASLAVREAELAGERAQLYKAEQAARAGGKRFEAAPGSYQAVAEPAYAGLKTEARRVSSELKSSIETTEAILGNNRRELARLGITGTTEVGSMGRARLEVQAAFNRFSKALNKSGFSEDKLKKAVEVYEGTVAKAAEKAGIAVTGSGKQALMELAQAKVLQKELKSFPHTAESFAKMSDKRAEDLFATLGSATKLSNYSNIAPALEGQANALQEALGLQPNGVDGLRAAWNAARKAVKAERTTAKFADIKMQRAELGVRAADLQAERATLAAEKAKAPATEPYQPGIVKKGVASAVGFGAYKATAMATGHPLMALGAGAKARNAVLNFGAPKTPALLAARNATLGRIKQAVGRFEMKAGKVATVVGPKLSPLAVRLDGSHDTSTKDLQQLAYNRISEVASAAPHVKDTLYRGLEPILQEQPELGPAMHQAGVASFEALRSIMPTDPGVVSGLKSIWKPSRLQASVMSQQLEVWQDPVGAAESILSTGVHDPIRVKALKEFAPAVFQHLRVEMLGRITQPGFLDGMNYRDQVALGTMLEIPIHSSMRPEFIAASQQLHVSRNEPLPSPAIPGSTNGGRPAADTPGATAAQISTSR